MSIWTNVLRYGELIKIARFYFRYAVCGDELLKDIRNSLAAQCPFNIIIICYNYIIIIKQGRKHPLDTPKRMIERG